MTELRIDDLVFCELLPEMFKRVGLKKTAINDLTKKPNWFTEVNWTEKEEATFRKWLVSKLTKRLNITKEEAEEKAEIFLLQYGWSTGNEKQLKFDF